jgi:DNA-cytosine methyltransferase
MYNQLKKQLRLIISEQFPENEVCLLLSGGADSTVVGLVADELGKKITSISYHLDGQTSWDFQTAKSTANKLGWIFHEVIVPTRDPKIDFLNLVQNHECKKKTEVEVLFPFISLIEKVKDLGFKKVLTGFSSPLPDGRKDSVKIKQNNYQYWEEALASNFDSSATELCIEFAKKQKIQVLQPLNDSSLIKILSGKTWNDIHKPYWKSPWKLPYRKSFENLGLLTLGKTPSLQIGGGVESYFSPLINDPEINFKGYISGNTTQKLSQLIRLWSNIEPSSEITPYPIRYEFKPYFLKDVITASDREDFTVVSTFAGGGGSSTGYRLGGGKILLVNEFIPEAVETYKANYPLTPVEMIDIRKITRRGGRQYVLDWFKSYGIDEGEYDILDGSPPCSTFSTSGKGKKKIEEKNVKYSDTTQDRIGMLIHDFVYMANCTKPKVCVIENVPSIKSSDVFFNALNRLRRWGYKVNFKVLCSSNFGVPQRRNRLIVLAVRPDICRKVGINSDDDILDIYPQGSIYEPTLRDGLQGVFVDLQQRSYLLMTSIKSSGYELIKSIPKNPSHPMKLADVDPDWTSDFNLVRASWEHPSPTLTQMGQQGGRGGIHHPNEDRVFTTNELKRLMGLPDDFHLTGTFNQKAERCGRMVTPNLYKHLSRSIFEKVILPSR